MQIMREKSVRLRDELLGGQPNVRLQKDF